MARSYTLDEDEIYVVIYAIGKALDVATMELTRIKLKRVKAELKKVVKQ